MGCKPRFMSLRTCAKLFKEFCLGEALFFPSSTNWAIIIGSLQETPEQEKAAGDSVWGNPKPCTDLKLYETTARHCLTSMSISNRQLLFVCSDSPFVWLFKSCTEDKLFTWKVENKVTFLPLTTTYSEKMMLNTFVTCVWMKMLLHLLLYIFQWEISDNYVFLNVLLIYHA